MLAADSTVVMAPQGVQAELHFSFLPAAAVVLAVVLRHSFLELAAMGAVVVAVEVTPLVEQVAEMV